MDESARSTAPLACPICADDLAQRGAAGLVCPENHEYTGVSLALTTNIAALKALWQAIRALEDDAASLTYMADNYGNGFGMSPTRRRAEAAEALEAADRLRSLAQRAQERLDALRVMPSAADTVGGQRGSASSSGPSDGS